MQNYINICASGWQEIEAGEELVWYSPEKKKRKEPTIVKESDAKKKKTDTAQLSAFWTMMGRGRMLITAPRRM